MEKPTYWTEIEAWLRTQAEIRAALRGDPVAIANNVKAVDLMRQREERYFSDECAGRDQAEYDCER